MKDCSIIKKMKQNNEKALNSLIEKYSRYVVAIVIGIGGTSLTVQDIEEITSDVFFAIWKKRDSLERVETLKPYIAQTARNMTRNKLYQVKEEEPLNEDILVFVTEKTDELLIHKEQITIIKEVISIMKYPDKDILIAYYFLDLKLQEIALKYELPLSTVKSKLYRGRKLIIESFGKGGYVYEN